MLNNMKLIMGDRIKSLSWMDRETKEIALKKVTHLLLDSEIHPPTWRSFA